MINVSGLEITDWTKNVNLDEAPNLHQINKYPSVPNYADLINIDGNTNHKSYDLIQITYPDKK
jgi:catalase (peroxidase I)